MDSIDRRRFLRRLVMGVAGFSAAACAPPPTPTAPSAPAKATAQPTPVAQPTPAPKPTVASTQPAPTVAKAAPTAKTPVKAILAFPAPSVTSMPYFIGREKGYFREEGVDLEIQQIPSANAIKGMLAGQVEFTNAAGTAMASIVGGAPLKIIVISTHGPVTWLYARSQYKSIAELRGKSIIISAFGDFSHNLVRAALVTANLNPETDVTYVAIPGANQNRLQALLAGAADAAIVSPPENLTADRQGLSRLLFLSDRVKLMTDGVATTDALIKEKPDVVRGMVRGSLKSLMLLKNSKAQAVPLLAAHLSVDETDAASLYDTTIAGFGDQGYEGDDVLQATIESQKQVSQVKEDVPLSKAFDLSFVKQAAQEIKASGWKP